MNELVPHPRAVPYPFIPMPQELADFTSFGLNYLIQMVDRGVSRFARSACITSGRLHSTYSGWCLYLYSPFLISILLTGGMNLSLIPGIILSYLLLTLNQMHSCGLRAATLSPLLPCLRSLSSSRNELFCDYRTKGTMDSLI
jgi:hypothetical protein